MTGCKDIGHTFRLSSDSDGVLLYGCIWGCGKVEPFETLSAEEKINAPLNELEMKSLELDSMREAIDWLVQKQQGSISV